MRLDDLMSARGVPTPPLQLVEEINHRVVNEYAEAISSLSLAAARASSPAVRAALSFAAGRLRAHAETHRALLPPSADGLMCLTNYLERICMSLSQASLADAGASLALKADDIWLDADVCWRVGLILAELVRNAARHGLRGQAGTISVRLRALNGQAHCLVSDNGPQVAGAQPGRGQKLARMLAEDLGGSVDWWFTPVGCVARLLVPLPSAEEARAN